jgi:predicted O-linked N-acetylglucosamine transferase (SPINDLY family)
MQEADLQTAVSLDPENDSLRMRYAISLMETGNLTEAEQQARLLQARRPKDVQLCNLLGIIFKRQRRYPEAINEFSKAARRDPSHVSAWVNLGNVHTILEDGAKAVECFSKAVRLEPRNAEHQRLLGSAYGHCGQHGRALEHLQKALALSRNEPRMFLELGAAYYRVNDFDRALQEIERGLAVAPNHLGLRRGRAMVLRRLHRVEEARQIYESILQERPNDTETLTALANLHVGQGDREAANRYFERALEADPNNEHAAAQYCECLLDSRYGNEAEHIEKAYAVAHRLVRRTTARVALAHAMQGVFLRMADYESLAMLGDRSKLIKHWLDTMNVAELHNQLGRVATEEDRLDLVDAHRRWGEKIDELIKRQPPIRRSPAPSGRQKIRVALVSSDLRNHPVTYFVEPIIEHYDRSRFEFYCYSFYPKEADRVQQWIVSRVEKFCLYPELSDRDIAQKIADDQVDILFELGGTTHFNRLLVMAHRPAPIQVSWLGYPHSVGLSTIDYILVDPYLKPKDPRLLIERPFLMPETWVCLGKLGFYNIPIEPGIPEERAGRITFGTMNNPYKYTPTVMATWAEVLKRVPGSRFLFVRPEGGTPSFRRNIQQEFAKHGIGADRVEFVAVRGKHLPFYNRMDIALEPFPHVGGTTTCETLWMGVPAVTLVGPAFFERLSYSNLNNAGLGDLCANTTGEYVRLAVEMAAHRDRRRALRHGLREQIRNHPLGQRERFVRNFEKVIEETVRTHRS